MIRGWNRGENVLMILFMCVFCEVGALVWLGRKVLGCP